MATDRGRRLAELRRSAASGIHGKTAKDRVNAERAAIEQDLEAEEGDE